MVPHLLKCCERGRPAWWCSWSAQPPAAPKPFPGRRGSRRRGRRGGRRARPAHAGQGQAGACAVSPRGTNSGRGGRGCGVCVATLPPGTGFTACLPCLVEQFPQAALSSGRLGPPPLPPPPTPTPTPTPTHTHPTPPTPTPPHPTTTITIDRPSFLPARTQAAGAQVGLLHLHLRQLPLPKHIHGEGVFNVARGLPMLGCSAGCSEATHGLHMSLACVAPPTRHFTCCLPPCETTAAGLLHPLLRLPPGAGRHVQR